MPFSSLGLAEPLVRAVNESGYTEPSPIQAQAIPAILSGRDVMAAAQTGTGKTAGFTLPLLQRLDEGRRARANEARALVITPTRELAAQVADSVATYGKYLSLTSAVVFGGVKINPQMKRLRGGVDVLVATPGRLLDLYSQNAVRFPNLEILVLDEADRMLDMGFIRDIRKILSLLPEKRQNLLFSATFSGEIRTLAASLMNEPLQISVSPRNTAATSVKQSLYEVDKSRKTALLIHLIKKHDWSQVLVFSRTKHGANRIARKLENAGITAAAIHGNKSQGARTRALADFKANKTRVLMATDIAARGIDIRELPHVINFDLPNVSEDYVHRIGRTGRAGSEGEAISLVSADEAKHLSGIENLIRQRITRETEAGFVPTQNVPLSRIGEKNSKPKRSKRKQRGGGQGASRHSAHGNGDSRPSGKPRHGRKRNPRHASSPSAARPKRKRVS